MADVTTTTSVTPPNAAPATSGVNPVASPAPAGTPPWAPPAPGTGSPPPNGASTFTVPEGYRLIPVSEHDTFVRNSQRVSGQDRLIQPLVESGFTDPEEIKRLAGVGKQARESGVDLSSVLSVFGPKAPTPAAPMTAPQQTVGLSADEVDQRINAANAVREHQSAMQSQSSKFDALATSIAGEGADPKVREEIRDIIETKWGKSAQFYETGHPMRDSAFRPFTDAEFQQFSKSVHDSFALVRAQAMASMGQAAGRTTPTGQPAMNATGNQTPGGVKPIGQMSRAEREEYARRHLTAASGGPTSQVV